MRMHPFLVAPFLTAALLPLTSGAPVQASAGTTPKVPASALAIMKPGGISLRYEKLPLTAGGAPVEAHLYTVPAGHIAGPNPYRGGPAPTPGSPFKRDDIARGPASLITASPFYLDLFMPAAKHGQLKRINSVRFTESRDIDGIMTRFLQPTKKSGPMLLMGFSSLGTYDVTVATFPRGLAAPASVDRFSGGGAGGGGVQLKFDRVDSRGFITVEKKPYTKIYNDRYERFVWNGRHFVKVADVTDPQAPQTRILTETDNGSQVTLNPGEKLVVRLPDMGSTGSVWSLVDIPGMPVRLESQQRTRGNAMVGAPGVHEWKFIGVVASFEKTTYLKLLQLRPFEAGIANARLWEVKVTVPASR